VQIAVAQLDLGAQALQRVDVDVHGPRADGAAAGERHHGLPFAREQGPRTRFEARILRTMS
jgi:hypothetical protein